MNDIGNLILNVFTVLCVAVIIVFFMILFYDIYKNDNMSQEQKKTKIQVEIDKAEKLCNGKKGCQICIEDAGRYCKLYYTVQ